jgi:hypothetical protein
VPPVPPVPPVSPVAPVSPADKLHSYLLIARAYIQGYFCYHVR